MQHCKSCSTFCGLWSSTEVEAAGGLLSHGSTEAEILVLFLHEVLGACQNVGLHVVASVCDVGTSCVKAMNCWVQPEVSHSSSFKIKQLQQYMTLHTT